MLCMLYTTYDWGHLSSFNSNFMPEENFTSEDNLSFWTESMSDNNSRLTHSNFEHTIYLRRHSIFEDTIYLRTHSICVDAFILGYHGHLRTQSMFEDTTVIWVYLRTCSITEDTYDIWVNIMYVNAFISGHNVWQTTHVPGYHWNLGTHSIFKDLIHPRTDPIF